MKEIKTIMLFLLLTISQYSPMIVSGSNSTHQGYSTITHGTIGTAANKYGVYDCNDPAFSFINCPEWLKMNNNNKGKIYGTTVIIDQGLRREQYNFLEENLGDSRYPSIDIIRYLTPKDSSGKSIGKIYGGVGEDNLKYPQVTDNDLEYKYDKDHGVMVSFAFGTLARGAKVIYIPAMTDMGFQDLSRQPAIWEWILNNIDTYDIRVISMSWTIQYLKEINPTDQVPVLLKKIANKGVLLLTSAGNDGKYKGLNQFPYSLDVVKGVGSVDHENRGKAKIAYWNGIPYTYIDPDYYSIKGAFSGSSEEARTNRDGCYNRETPPFCSSYGESLSSVYLNGQVKPNRNDFVMPGNGVPGVKWVQVGFEWVGVSYYTFGTSISTPYLAAAAIIAYTGYVFGYGGYAVYDRGIPLYDFLRQSASLGNGYPDSKMGWGYVTLDSSYMNGYTEGRHDYYQDGGPL